MLDTVLLVFAFVLFVCAAFNVPSPRWWFRRGEERQLVTQTEITNGLGERARVNLAAMPRLTAEEMRRRAAMWRGSDDRKAMLAAADTIDALTAERQARVNLAAIEAMATANQAQRRQDFEAGSEATFGTHGGKWWWRGVVYETLDDAVAAYLKESER